MSSTTTPSPTTTSPSPASSGTQHAQSGVTIPTTTVVGIGAGFVAFALSLLGCLLLVRFFKLALRARREGIPVRQAWNDQGGLFGWLHGFGAQDRETDRRRRIEEIERSGYWAGGGGWYSSEILRMRLWNEIRREGMKVKDDLGERPGMWEVGLGEGTRQENVEELEDEKRLDAYHVSLVISHVVRTIHSCDRWFQSRLDRELIIQPLSIGPTLIPFRTAQAPAQPIMRLSLLIALPTSAISANPSNEDEDLPELVIGSTLLTPTMPTSDEMISPSTGQSKDNGEKVLEVAHLEYGSGSLGGGRAVWIKKGDRWVIEGLEDCMGGTTTD